MKLSKTVSQTITKELVQSIGEARLKKILVVGDARLKAFVAGRGCLSIDQLERISTETRKRWEHWAVDAGARGLKTSEGRAFVARARRVWDEISEPEKKAPVRSTRRTSSLLRTVV